MNLRDKHRTTASAVAFAAPEKVQREDTIDAPQKGTTDLNLAAFFRLLLPQAGAYITFQNKQHTYHDTIEDLTQSIEDRIETQGLYFATAAFGQERNRTQANVRALRAYRLDLDAGEAKLAKHGPTKVYPTQQDAIRGVVRAVNAGLPLPTLIVSSGEGLHVYWALKEDIDPAAWKTTATALQALGFHLGLLIDSSVTCDSCRILRPVGTLHPNGSRVSIIKDTGATYYQGDIDRAIRAIKLPEDTLAMLLSAPKAVRNINDDVLEYKGPPASLVRVAEHCGAVAEMRDTRGLVAEPHWRAVMGVGKYCVDGADTIHAWSDAHPDYDYAATQRKFDAWETPPTSCAHFSTLSDACKSCPFRGKVTTPKQLGVDRESAITALMNGGAAPPSLKVLKDVLPDWSRTQDGTKVRAHNTTDNLEALAKLAGISIRYNVMTRKGEIRVPDMKSERDDFDTAALARLGDVAIRAGMNRAGIKELADAVAGKEPYHPVLQWIKSKPWDGTSRLSLFRDTLEVADGKHQALRDALLDPWALQCIGALIEPDGIATQGALILNGDQGINKTRWVANMSPIAGAIRTGFHLNPQDKDSVFQATSAWITELGEVDSTFRRSDVSALKAFITRPEDVLRRPYALTENTYRRRTVFAGTVNGTGYLADDTGDRRFWIINVKRCHLLPAEVMQQVWAEYLVKYQAGERWHLSAEVKAALNTSNAAHRVIDPIQERILTAFDWSKCQQDQWHKGAGVRRMTATDVCIRIGITHPSRAEATRAGAIVMSLNGRVTYKSNGSKLLALPPLSGWQP